MARPASGTGRLLEPMSDYWPRRMIVQDRTRLTGQLNLFNIVQRVVNNHKQVLLFKWFCNAGIKANNFVKRNILFEDIRGGRNKGYVWLLIFNPF